MSKRKYFSVEEKVKIISYAKENPQLGSRKLAAEFGCGRTCIKTLMNQKEVIMTDWKCSENSSLKKKGSLKNTKTSTMLSGVGFVWQGKHLYQFQVP